MFSKFCEPHQQINWRRKWQPTPVFLPGESQGWRSLWAAIHGVAQIQTRLKQLSMHACIGEGNGNPLQCSCLENPRSREAWWAAVYGITQSRTRLKRLSSSSSKLTKPEEEILGPSSLQSVRNTGNNWALGWHVKCPWSGRGEGWGHTALQN